MKNWKTTLAGIFAAVGTYLASSDNQWLHIAGLTLSAVSVSLLGMLAKDHDVTGR
jgi:multisubunit Na+/H+ antiporter MnhC subunit